MKCPPKRHSCLKAELTVILSSALSEMTWFPSTGITMEQLRTLTAIRAGSHFKSPTLSEIWKYAICTTIIFYVIEM